MMKCMAQKKRMCRCVEFEDVTDDEVQRHAMKFLSYGLLYWEFSDSIREGDGLRILRCWRYLLFFFKASKRYNYSIEAHNMLAQYHFWLSPRQSMQLIWSRCVNTHGIPGRNIPSDLHLET
jgi:L1 cell adhesion molecule like protein